MIKKYAQFILENKYVDIEHKYNTMGDYISKIGKSLNKENWDNFLRITGKYLDIDESSADISIANAVNLLQSFDQRMLAQELMDEFNITESVANEFENDLKEYSPAGYGAFNSFLKVISAIGIKDINKSADCPNIFFTIYIMKTVNNMKLKDVLMRFKSLKWGQKIINDYLYQNIDIYYGIKWSPSNKSFNFEYGFIINKDERHPVGEFKLTNSIINKFRTIKSKSILTLNKDLAMYDVKVMKLMMRMKLQLIDYEPGKYIEKSAVVINKDIISISYYGLGTWKSGEYIGDIMEIKDDFKGWIMSKKWNKYILISVVPDNNMNIHFKLKIK